MMRIVLLLIIVSFASCEKKSAKTCICEDYNNGFKEVQRYSDIDELQCLDRQTQWRKINSGVTCNLK